MCADCFETSYYEFKTEWEFEQFAAMLKQVLRHKFATGQLRELPVDEPVASTGQAEQRFLCRSCGTTWVLSSPDNAWRGYFLPEAEAAAHLSRLAKHDKYRRLGCLAILLVVLALGLWRLMR